MSKLHELWKETNDNKQSLENEIVKRYENFLREVAKHFLAKGSKVYFRENKVVHYGEGGFGALMIEGNYDMDEIFGDYISEIRFEQNLDEKRIRGCTEINKSNINDIRYTLYY